jgi:phosphatidylserine decarboxylase
VARATTVILCGVLAILVVTGAFIFWRYVWFFRNPARIIPAGENMVSPADGTVVYVKKIQPGADVFVIKQGVSAKISDIVKEELTEPKILIGIFMSPFDVHYNRSPIEGSIGFVRHYPAKTKNLDMRSMHFRTLIGLAPYYLNSRHIIENERSVTRIIGKFKEELISLYVVQIAGGHVSGIDSYVPENGRVDKGSIFGMIRIGSQVDLILPDLPGMKIKVAEGETVKAGESILVE